MNGLAWFLHRGLLVAMLAPALACSDDPATAIRSRSGSQAAQGRVSGTGASGLRIREKPTTASAQLGTLEEGQLVAIRCQIEGESVDGNTVWDFVEAGGGYVSDAYIDKGAKGFVSTIDRCDAPAPEPPPPPTSDSPPTTTSPPVDIEGPTVRPHVQVFANDACAVLKACTVSTYEGHQPRAELALDFLTSEEFGSLPTDNHGFGDRLADYAVTNLKRYRIEYVIYRQRINHGDGWESMEDRGGTTENHFDHVHVSFDP